MARVWTREGTEGPRHDPYSWCEIHFEKTDGTLVRLRQGGLGYSRLYVNGALVAESHKENEVEPLFEQHTGMNWWRAMNLPDFLRERKLRRMTPAQRATVEAAWEADVRTLRWAA